MGNAGETCRSHICNKILTGERGSERRRIEGEGREGWRWERVKGREVPGIVCWTTSLSSSDAKKALTATGSSPTDCAISANT
jgi:hypothetical protein